MKNKEAGCFVTVGFFIFEEKNCLEDVSTCYWDLPSRSRPFSRRLPLHNKASCNRPDMRP
jgi:hypothetical protein